MDYPIGRPKIALIHNTNVHVETAISLYFTLERSGRWLPTLILLPKDARGLNAFLDHLGVRYLTTGFSSDDYEKAIVVTSYPSGAEHKRLSNENHPMVRGFEGRRVLVTHRADYPRSAYKGEVVVGLMPLCERYGVPYVYACENPALETPFFDDWENKVFLIQGKFGSDHRNLQYIQRLLANTKRLLRIRLLGDSASSIALCDSRVEIFDRVPEIEFYNLCRKSHFILPLVDGETRRGQYLRCRFSSTYGLAFSSQKLLVSAEGVDDIYNVPALTYKTFNEFCSRIIACVDMTVEDYALRCAPYVSMKEKFREHNVRVLRELLSFG